MTADEALKRREDRLKDFVEKHQGDFSDRERDAILHANMVSDVLLDEMDEEEGDE